jgi:uncharacterized 2Fe-2S/4Fe-4S cluster protein (DUF4445 family)
MTGRRSATWTVPPGLPGGTTLLDALRDEGIAVPAECGGVGTCGLCLVRLSPAPEPGAADLEQLDADRLAAGWRLACATPALPGTVVHLPEGVHRAPASARAATRRKPSVVPHPGRPGGGIGRVRAAGAKGDAALAVDLGTTTVCVALVSLRDGAILAEASASNAQRSFGGDVVSRIEYGGRGPAELARLRDAAIASVSEAAEAACALAGLDPSAVSGGSVACNPTMAHLLLGANPAPLGRAPFRLVVAGTVILAAKRIGFPGDPDGLVTVLPPVSATLGGDAVGGAVALGLDRPAGGVRLLVDVGTNTEMVLAEPSRHRWLAASAASGGAFEGASISCGVRFGPGAVTAVGWDGGDLSATVEGGGPPRGLSGSGLLGLIALLRRFDVVDPTGRLKARGEAFESAPPALTGRLLPLADGEQRFLVARTAGGVVSLSASDIRQFQLAKGAIRAALDILLEEGGVAPGDVAEIFLAGAFGTGIDEDAALDTGLFPAPFRGRFSRAGNASLAAAVESIRDGRFLDRADTLAGGIRALSLPDHPAFQERFLAAMDFRQVFRPGCR